MKRMAYLGANAVVVGFGVTGKAVFEYLSGAGANVQIFDDNVSNRKDLKSDVPIQQVGPSFVSAAKAADLVVVSPGIPRSHMVFDLGVDAISELELAYRNSDTPMLAVTGTNGKTTVTTLISRMLSLAGYGNAAVGNIGTPVISKVDERFDYLVVEASSFQLATTKTFRPKVAAFTNFSPDHLDWHLGVDDYLLSKSKIFANQFEGDYSVLNGADEIVSRIQLPGQSTKVLFGKGDFQYSISADGKALEYFGESFVSTETMKRVLPHDLENALASAAVAHSVGISFEHIAEVLSEFEGLPHRVELVTTWDGVSYFDDSKATTPASVVAALKGFDSAVLIAGGQNKGLDLSPLSFVAEHVRAVVAIGHASEQIIEIFSQIDGIKVVKAESMDEAVALAKSLSIEGDSVVLSPGCTSFDWYRSYVERGDDFKRAVNALAHQGGGQ